jgi:hypothetical protein
MNNDVQKRRFLGALDARSNGMAYSVTISIPAKVETSIDVASPKMRPEWRPGEK